MGYYPMGKFPMGKYPMSRCSVGKCPVRNVSVEIPHSSLCEVIMDVRTQVCRDDVTVTIHRTGDDLYGVER